MFSEPTPVFIHLMGKGKLVGKMRKTEEPGVWEVTVPPTSAWPEGFVTYPTTGAMFNFSPVDEADLERLAENVGALPFDTWYLRDKQANVVDIYDGDDYDDEGDSEDSEADDEYWDDMDEEYGPDDFDVEIDDEFYDDEPGDGDVLEPDPIF